MDTAIPSPRDDANFPRGRNGGAQQLFGNGGNVAVQIGLKVRGQPLAQSIDLEARRCLAPLLDGTTSWAERRAHYI
eukprot:SAG31_NODE_2151_length_6325_cov_2.165275_2_plen_76_part_00